MDFRRLRSPDTLSWHLAFFVRASPQTPLRLSTTRVFEVIISPRPSPPPAGDSGHTFGHPKVTAADQTFEFLHGSYISDDRCVNPLLQQGRGLEGPWNSFVNVPGLAPQQSTKPPTNRDGFPSRSLEVLAISQMVRCAPSWQKTLSFYGAHHTQSKRA